ncbi:F-box domain-containing protein [Durotheca rogersii]|uniref:F-box domain-containing protein n=1 Tax=Durotheca rogersii TaxID=419775 RepID=UPI00221EA28D|nr:F-box domain-containing protein [Durotheca rogersii]KAI5859649.1 F-box domain-containing protein [Durotheca rogersii]
MACPNCLDNLPDEIFLHILSFLESSDVVTLQRVSKHFLGLCRDGNFWRNRCLSTSAVRERIRLCRWGPDWIDEDGTNLGQATPGDDQNGAHWSLLESLSQLASKRREREQIRIAANWDPTFPNEKTSWYNEYIRRNAPIAVSWFEQPHVKKGSLKDSVDVSGVALYRPQGRELFAVSPLDDGSVCLWDVEGSRGRKGSILSKSGPGLLCTDGPGANLTKRSKMVSTGVTECVSVDSQTNRAFFAVQGHLIEVNLETLQVVGNHPFEWSITTLSAADPTVPLTVGTLHGLHLHDFRARSQYQGGQMRLDNLGKRGGRDFTRVLDPRPLAPYASLAQSGPQSILHLGLPGDISQLSTDIFVAGRFSNILHYDRRMFPAIRGSIHSGAKLCSLTSLPYPFSSLDSDLRRHFQLSEEQVEKAKSVTGGRTLIACGEYNTKGSLELYGLSSPGADDASESRVIENSTMKNRQTASQSKLLSVINHGTCIVFSDGQGYLKWFERDGFTEVRRHKIGKSEKILHRSLFGSMPGSDDIARKILSTQPSGQDGETQVNKDDILFWTGEKLGVLGFSSQTGFSAEDFEENTKTPDEMAAEEEEQMYGERMRLALERQANEVRFVQDLGAGNLRNGP